MSQFASCLLIAILSKPYAHIDCMIDFKRASLMTSFFTSAGVIVCFSSTSNLFAVLGQTPGIDCSGLTSKVSTASCNARGSILAIPKAVFGPTPEIFNID